ncbi:MAG: cysteine dioxygenase family protein [Candidatus Sericytochromatia bacterium]
MYHFSNFCSDLEYIVDTSSSYKELVTRGSAIMQKLVNTENLINSEQIHKISHGEMDNYVYRSEKNDFVVQIFTWWGHTETPVHDHGTWGLMGIYQNTLRVAEFRYINQDLKETESYIVKKGDVAYLIPPDEEIHHVSNINDEMSISIHVYGKDIKEYNIYDLENGEIIHQVV